MYKTLIAEFKTFTIVHFYIFTSYNHWQSITILKEGRNKNLFTSFLVPRHTVKLFYEQQKYITLYLYTHI